MRTITITFDGDPYLPGLLNLIADRRKGQLEKLHPGESFTWVGVTVSMSEDPGGDVVVRDSNGAVIGCNWVKVLGKPCSDEHAMAMSDGIPVDCPRCG